MLCSNEFSIVVPETEAGSAKPEVDEEDNSISESELAVGIAVGVTVIYEVTAAGHTDEDERSSPHLWRRPTGLAHVDADKAIMATATRFVF